jgi:hypothetical protein
LLLSAGNFDFGAATFNREETAMSVHHRKYADQREQTPLDRDHKQAAGIVSGDLQSKSARRPGFNPPTINQDTLTIIFLMTIMVLSALNFMLRFPGVAAVITQYNQF